MSSQRAAAQAARAMAQQQQVATAAVAAMVATAAATQPPHHLRHPLVGSQRLQTCPSQQWRATRTLLLPSQQPQLPRAAVQEDGALGLLLVV